MPPSFGAGKKPHEAISCERRSERNTTDGHDHSNGHRRRDGETGNEHAARKRAAHDEGGERAGNNAGHKGEGSAVAAVSMVVLLQRAPEEEAMISMPLANSN